MIDRFLTAALLALFTCPLYAADYPVTVRSCDRDVTFERAPERAVSHDINMTSMLITLGLRDHMAGYTGISGWKTLDPALAAKLGDLPELASRYPSIETLIEADADLYFAGWNYGMRTGGAVTPSTLEPLGIPVYELSESCSWVMKQKSASFAGLYNDLENLGRIFSVPERSETLIHDLKRRIETVRTTVRKDPVTPRVFLYDSGEDRPTTSGQMGMPQALIEAAGGKNIMGDVPASWTQVNWESVVERDPEVIVIVDYGPRSWQQKRDFLLQQPALQDVQAIRERRFIVLSYLEVTPSVMNATAIEKMAAALHPQLLNERTP